MMTNNNGCSAHTDTITQSCDPNNIIMAWLTYQSIYENLSTLLTLMECVNICQLLQKVHHGDGNMFIKLRVNLFESMSDYNRHLVSLN